MVNKKFIVKLLNGTINQKKIQMNLKTPKIIFPTDYSNCDIQGPAEPPNKLRGSA